MKSFRSGLLSVLSSVKLTISLLLILAAMGIIGTVLPQEEPQEVFGLCRLLSALKLYDVFHSVLFYLVMILLTLNLVFCSISRFPQALKRFRGEVEGARFKRKETLTLRLDPDEIRKKIHFLLKRRRYTIFTSPGENELRGQKGLLSYLGAYIVHVGVFVLLVGTLISSLLSLEGYVNIREGETVDHIETGRNNPISRSLPFQIHLEKFTVEWYENGMPKQYRSDLKILKDGKTAIEAPLTVNHPIVVDGFYIYQASYGEMPTPEARLLIIHGREKIGEITVTEGKAFPLPRDEKVKVSVLRVESDFMRMGPAVKLAIHSDGGEFVFWVFKQIEEIVTSNPGILKEVPMINPHLYPPYTFVLTGLKSALYSGLQVKRDPGAPLVGVGAIIVIFGLIVTYFISPRSLTIRWERKDTGTEIYIKGTAAKDASALNRDLSYLIGELKE